MEKFKGSLKGYFAHIDLPLFITSILCAIYGMVLITSASRSYHSNVFIKVQIAAAILGIAIFIFVSFFDLDIIARYWKVLYIVNILFIGSLFFLGVGESETGNRAWIRFGPIGIQPGEVGKILFIITLSCHIHQLKDRLNAPSSILQLVGHMLIPVGLILFAAKDAGMAIIYFLIFLVVTFIAGVKFRYYLITAGALLAMSPLVWFFFMKEYQRLRILVVFNPELDPLGKGYHAIQSKIAIGAGQIFGRGLFNGSQTQNGWLPAKHTDFIFSVAGEELGMVGCLVIILLLLIIIIRAVLVSANCRDDTMSQIAGGIAAILIFQTFENIGMCLGFFPIIGLTLPFFSYGGSSLLTSFIAVGILGNIAVRNKLDRSNMLIK